MNTCWCGARVINGHHCENGHLQDRHEARGIGLAGDARSFESMLIRERVKGDLRRTGEATAVALNSDRDMMVRIEAAR